MKNEALLRRDIYNRAALLREKRDKLLKVAREEPELTASALAERFGVPAKTVSKWMQEVKP